MAVFFDTGNAEHLKKVHPLVRSSVDLRFVVDLLEEAALEKYRVLVSASKQRVMLVGYDNTTPTASKQPLKDAIVATVADAASRVLRHPKFHQFLVGLKSERLDYYEYELQDAEAFSSDALSALAGRAWTWRLARFDKRPDACVV